MLPWSFLCLNDWLLAFSAALQVVIALIHVHRELLTRKPWVWVMNTRATCHGLPWNETLSPTTQCTATAGVYPCHYFVDHNRYWLTTWALVQLVKGDIDFAQPASMAFGMDLGSMDGKREHLEYNWHIQSDTLYLPCNLKLCQTRMLVIYYSSVVHGSTQEVCGLQIQWFYISLGKKTTWK